MKTEAKKPSRQQRPLLRWKRILVPTDFSKHAEQALRYAVPLAQQVGARITLLHVIDRPVIPAELGMLMIDEDKVVGLARTRLQELARLNVPEGLVEKTVVRIGRAFQEISRSAQSLRTDLVVIASQGNTGLKRTVLGSTVERVVRHASCPVLTVKPAGGGKAPGRRAESLAPRINRILVPVDFSPSSRQAARFAAALAQTMQARLTLLHVAEPLSVGVFSGFPDEVARHSAEAKREALQTLEKLAATLPKGIRTDVLVRQDVPHAGIVDAARELRSDLIVLPTRGLTGLKHIMVGSTAERVVRHAPCPVFVVR